MVHERPSTDLSAGSGSARIAFVDKTDIMFSSFPSPLVTTANNSQQIIDNDNLLHYQAACLSKLGLAHWIFGSIWYGPC